MRELVCAECGEHAQEHARGWWALIAYEPDHEPKPETVYVFCRECGERKFGHRNERLPRRTLRIRCQVRGFLEGLGK
jgi:formylmethanofuran dehydrogenase subunit E